MNPKPTDCYIEVDVKERLPENHSWGIFIDHEGDANMDNGFKEPDYYKAFYTHWLEKKKGVLVITVEELEKMKKYWQDEYELLTKYWYSGAKPNMEQMDFILYHRKKVEEHINNLIK